MRSVALGFPKWIVPAATKPLWRLQSQAERYTSVLELFQEPARTLLQVECEGNGVFEYRGDAINISWQSAGTGFEHYLQTIGLSLWLEVRGVPCIHANAIATDAGVIGLIAPSQTGKTTLSAALATRSMAIMTDDMMAVHKTQAGWTVFPAWPQLRMWPEVAKHFVGSAESLPRVHGRFEKRVVNLADQSALRNTDHSGPLKCLYLLDRRRDETTAVSIAPVTAAQSMLALLQNSMLADAYRPLGIESSRLKTLASLLEAVPVKRVVYPSGKQHLDNICERIEIDVKTL